MLQNMQTLSDPTKEIPMTRPTTPLLGLHHVTAIASDPRVNLAFYTEVLGQRLVKKTVNFDDPNTYHLYYGNEAGEPGSILTFFPWPGARRGSGGAGQATLTSYAIPHGSASYWYDRLRRQHVPVDEPAERFGEASLVLVDPDGMRLELVEANEADALPAWPGSPSAPVDERHAIRGFRGVTLSESQRAGTRRFLSEVLGFEEQASEGKTTRYRVGADPLGHLLDVSATEDHGRPGAGTVHHVAFRIQNDESELDWHSFLTRQGQHVSPVMDRQYFHSIYFREPGGVLFEIATDPPGFAVDEPLESLGEELKLPAGLEPHRRQIEAALPTLSVETGIEA